MREIYTFLMFSGARHGKARDAVDFYTSMFPNSRIEHLELYGSGEREPEGTVRSAVFTLNGRKFRAMDSAVQHAFNFTPSVSLFVECADEAEITRLYAALSEGGEVLMPLDNYGFSPRFGWINDRFGVSWQLNEAA